MFQSFVSILLATLTFYLFFLYPQKSDMEYVEQQILQYCPNNPELASRMANMRLYVALEIAQSCGEEGLEIVDYFGDEAVFLYETDRTSFQSLLKLTRLPNICFSISIGSWKDAVIKWAKLGTLEYYIGILEKLDKYDLEIINEIPQCLPVFTLQGIPITREMMHKYRDRAWSVFMFADFRSPQSLEKLAMAMKHYGELFLEINEEYSFTAILFFLNEEKDKYNALPDFYYECIKILGKVDAITLFLTQYSSVEKYVLESNKTKEQILAQIYLLNSLSEEMKNLFFDSEHTFKLLLESDIGFSVYKKCGPLAAEVLYNKETLYHQSNEKKSALIILDHIGYGAIESLLLNLGGWEPWHRLLRRTDLHLPIEKPVIAKIANRLLYSSTKQDEIENMIAMPQEQIDNMFYKLTSTEEMLPWIPGYYAVKLIDSYSKGYQIENMDMFFGLLEAMGGIAKAPKIISKLTSGLSKEVIEETGKSILKNMATTEMKDFAKKVMFLPGSKRFFIKDLSTQVMSMEIKQIMKNSLFMSYKKSISIYKGLNKIVPIKFYVAIHSVGEVSPSIMEYIYPVLSPESIDESDGENK